MCATWEEAMQPSLAVAVRPTWTSSRRRSAARWRCRRPAPTVDCWVRRRPGDCCARGCDGAAAGGEDERDVDARGSRRSTTTKTTTNSRYQATSASEPCCWTSRKTRRQTTSDASSRPRQRTTTSPVRLPQLHTHDVNCYRDTLSTNAHHSHTHLHFSSNYISRPLTDSDHTTITTTSTTFGFWLTGLLFLSLQVRPGAQVRTSWLETAAALFHR